MPKPIGVTLGWSRKIQLVFEDKKILPCSRLDRILHPEYFPNNCEWPVCPTTGEKLKIITDWSA